jgi:hypothetical protein
MMNSPIEPTTPMEELPQGSLVSDANGDKVGTVTLSALGDGYFVVEKGFLFTHELFLPVTAIQTRDADGVTLRLTKDELKQDQWKQPPSGMDTAVPLPAADPVNTAPVYPDRPMPNVGPANEPPPYPDAPMPHIGPAEGTGSDPEAEPPLVER